MKNFSLSMCDREFNDVIQIDVMYLGLALMLHAVDTTTGYSEFAVISARKAEVMLIRIWYLSHGAPKEVRGDREFDKGILREWLSFVPVPSRRHNKTGIFERKNKDLKDILEKFEQDKAFTRLRIQVRVNNAQFTSYILYGNNVLSAFEISRGYTPSIEGTGKSSIPEAIVSAHNSENPSIETEGEEIAENQGMRQDVMPVTWRKTF